MIPFSEHLCIYQQLIEQHQEKKSSKRKTNAYELAESTHRSLWAASVILLCVVCLLFFFLSLRFRTIISWNVLALFINIVNIVRIANICSKYSEKKKNQQQHYDKTCTALCFLCCMFHISNCLICVFQFILKLYVLFWVIFFAFCMKSLMNSISQPANETNTGLWIFRITSLNAKMFFPKLPFAFSLFLSLPFYFFSCVWFVVFFFFWFSICFNSYSFSSFF